MAHGADGIVIKIQSYQSAGCLASRNDSQQTSSYTLYASITSRWYRETGRYNCSAGNALASRYTFT